jgi:hypothetical protein
VRTRERLRLIKKLHLKLKGKGNIVMAKKTTKKTTKKVKTKKKGMC